MRILVPLDGSALARTVLPEAIRLVGKDGDLVLIRDATKPLPGGNEGESPEAHAVEVSESYLHEIAQLLQHEGVNVRVEAFFMADPADAIDEAARLFDVDLIACATEARTGLQRLVHPSVAWRALSRSPVPVLLHRPMASKDGSRQHGRIRLLVPLDGSTRSELAIPVAVRIAGETEGSVVLVRVVPNGGTEHTQSQNGDPANGHPGDDQAGAQTYLTGIASGIHTEVDTAVLVGGVVEQLTAAAERLEITDIVMASHGRTGLARVILGSVADDLVHAAEVSVIVVPAMAADCRLVHDPVANRSRREELAGVS